MHLKHLVTRVLRYVLDSTSLHAVTLNIELVKLAVRYLVGVAARCVVV